MSRIAVAALLVVILAVPSAMATPSKARPPAANVLTAFANVGTVYWRCASDGHGWQLGFRVPSSTADGYVTRRAGHARARRHIIPGHQAWFAVSTAAVQVLTASRGIEPNTVTGSVSAHFNGCYPYMPPDFTSGLKLTQH